VRFVIVESEDVDEVDDEETAAGAMGREVAGAEASGIRFE